jgi:phosphoadenosine phosphosulfate reductase
MKMNPETLDKLLAMDAEELIKYAFEQHRDRAAIGTSFQKTGTVTIDLASELVDQFRVFFIDTSLNPPETYELISEVENEYGIKVERFKPDPAEVKHLERTYGTYPHYFARQECCRVRKKLPHQKALATLDVWISGLRASQSEHREDNGEKVSIIQHAGRDILLINPLFDWSDAKIDKYISEKDLLINKLYNQVTPYGERWGVIGCKPCHIPTLEALGPRVGKFPWEFGKKECGLHEEGGGI